MRTKIIIFLFTGLCITLGCYREEEYNRSFDPDNMVLSISEDTLLADSASTTVITLELPSEADTTLSAVTFRTTAGNFVENGEKTYTTKAKKLDGQTKRTAQVTLRSSLKIENALVSIILFDNTRSDTIQFVNAFPQNLQLTPSSFTIQPSNSAAGEVNIEAQVLRSPGMPSVGNSVDVEAYDSLFKSRLGSFRIYNNKTNAAGKANFTFVLGDSVANHHTSPYTGRLYLVGKTLKDNTQYIFDTIQLVSSK